MDSGNNTPSTPNAVRTRCCDQLQNEPAQEERLQDWPHLCIITVDVVEDPDEDVLRDAVQSHHRDAGLRLQLLALTEMIFKKGFEIITATTEKCLQREERPKHHHFHCTKPESTANQLPQQQRPILEVQAL